MDRREEEFHLLLEDRQRNRIEYDEARLNWMGQVQIDMLRIQFEIKQVLKEEIAETQLVGPANPQDEAKQWPHSEA